MNRNDMLKETRQWRRQTFQPAGYLLLQLLIVLCFGLIFMLIGCPSAGTVTASLVHQNKANLLESTGFKVEARVQFWPDNFYNRGPMRTSNAEFTETYLNGRGLIEQRQAIDPPTKYYLSQGEDGVVKISALHDKPDQVKCEKIDRRALVDDLFELFRGTDQLADNWRKSTVDHPLPDHMIGFARLLLIFDANRDKLVPSIMQRVREMQAQRYEFRFVLGDMDAIMTAYMAQGVMKWADTEMPIRIWVKTKKQGLMMVDYYKLEPLSDRALYENLNYYLAPTTVKLGLGCSDYSAGEQSFPKFHEIYSMNFEIVRPHGDDKPKREEFIAFDGRQQVFRRDTRTSGGGSLISTTIYDLKRGVKFNLKQSSRSGSSAIANEAQQKDGCIMAPAWLGTQSSFMPFERFVKMGIGVVRGVEVTIFEHVSKTLPEVFHPQGRYLSESEGKIMSHSVKAIEMPQTDKEKRYSIVYYFANPPKGGKIPLGPLIRVDLMNDGKLLEQINVFNFVWQLTNAPNGDAQEHLFSVPISCNQDPSSSAISSLNMELEFQTATTSRITEREARSLFSSVPVRTKSLLRSLSEQASEFSTTQVVDIKTSLRDGHSPTDKFKLYASVKLALGHMSGVIYQPVYAARVIVHNIRRQSDPARSYEECFYEAARQFGKGKVIFAFIDEVCYIDPNPIYETHRREDGSEQLVFTYSNVFLVSRSPTIGFTALHVARVDLAEIDPLTPKQVAEKIYDSLTGKRLILPIVDTTHLEFLFESIMFKIDTIDFADVRQGDGGHQADHSLSGLAVINGKALKSSDKEVTVNYQSCHAACLFDPNCKSYSVCSRGLTMDCRTSELNFDDANLLLELNLQLRELEQVKRHQISFDFEPLDSDFVSEGENHTRKESRHVELYVDKRCQIYRKHALDMFTELPKSLTPLKRRALVEVDTKEQCAEMCLRNNMDFFAKYENFNMVDLKTSNRAAMMKQHSKNLRTWCATFRYLNLKTSSALSDESQPDNKLNKFQKDGLCMLSRPRGIHLKTNQSKSLNGGGSQANESEAAPILAMDVYEFNYLNLYEPRRNIMMLPYNQDSTPNTNQRGASNKRTMAHSNGPEECASACFTQATELVPYCKSFEFVRVKLPQTSEKESEETTQNSIMAQCFFNSMSINDTIEAGLYDKIVVKKTDPSIISLHHYEPHKAYLINNEFMEKLIEPDQSPSRLPETNGLLVFSIVIMALVSGIFLGFHSKDPLKQYLISLKRRTTEIKRQRFSNEATEGGGQENL